MAGKSFQCSQFLWNEKVWICHICHSGQGEGTQRNPTSGEEHRNICTGYSEY